MAPAAAALATETGVITCEFCGGSFSLRTATDEMDRLRADIRKWVAELSGGFNAGMGGGTVDEASRKFIFADKLLPSLQLAADRAIESFGMFRHGPLFSFPITNELPQNSQVMTPVSVASEAAAGAMQPGHLIACDCLLIDDCITRNGSCGRGGVAACAENFARSV